MTEKPFPDWCDPTQYPNPESTSRTQWAWEFLRRNKQYQTEWHHKDGEDYSIHCTHADFVPLHKWVSMMRLGAKWGLICHAPDPSVQFPEILLFQSSSIIGAMTYEDVEKYGEIPFVPSGWSIAMLVFNLESPLHPQLEEARVYLREAQQKFLNEEKIKPVEKAHRFPGGDLLEIYLRCLDARAKDVSIKEIASVVYPLISNEYPDYHGNQRVKDSLAAADELVKSNYLHLTNVREGK